MKHLATASLDSMLKVSLKQITLENQFLFLVFVFLHLLWFLNTFLLLIFYSLFYVGGRLDTTFYKSVQQSVIIFLNHVDWMLFIYQVWSSTKGHEVASLPGSGPLNCVTFDPEDRLLAAGCWNGNVIIWNWLQNKTQVVSYHEERPKKVMWVFFRTHMLALFDAVWPSMSGQHSWDLPFHPTT